MNKLEKATLYQREHYKRGKERPLYHFTAPVGWINDPNGFSIFEDKIHLFYQHHPYSTEWGPMYWGHAVSEDFIHWEDLPVALAPDRKYDAEGCFSGTAIDEDGKQILAYTGVEKYRDNGNLGDFYQQQCIAWGDGVAYEKSPYNPVIPVSLLPAGFSVNDFRDPKIFKQNGEYYMLIAARNKDGNGELPLYRSHNLRDWEFISIVAANDGTYGDMWECPDIFKLGGKDALIVSPMHIKPNKKGVREGYSTIMLVGEFRDFKFTDYEVISMDSGPDFYAAQTLLTKDGRRVLIAWMQAWENFIKPEKYSWHGMMTLPREICLENGRLIQRPVKEIERIRKNPVKLNGAEIDGETYFQGIEGRSIDVTVTLLKGNYSKFKFAFAKTGSSEISFTYDKDSSVITFDRESCKHNQPERADAFSNQQILTEPDGKPLKLRFLIDTCSVELFINDGVKTFTATYYLPMQQTKVCFSSDRTLIADIESYELG